jgi:hypothetical protein
VNTDCTKSNGFGWITTPQLLAAHAGSLAAEQNRLLTDEFLDSLAPEGIHVVQFVMRHVNYEGTKGIRTYLLCETRGETEPVGVFFDFMVEDFMALASECWEPAA